MSVATEAVSPWRGPHATMVIGTALMAAALAIAPLVGIYPVFLMKALCFALFACAFNLLLGFTGLLSFGHAAFFGAGAYIAGFTLLHWHLSPELGILTGVVEGLTKYFYPEASNTVIFVVMVIVLMVRPAGLFGRER